MPRMASSALASTREQACILPGHWHALLLLARSACLLQSQAPASLPCSRAERHVCRTACALVPYSTSTLAAVLRNQTTSIPYTACPDQLIVYSSANLTSGQYLFAVAVVDNARNTGRSSVYNVQASCCPTRQAGTQVPTAGSCRPGGVQVSAAAGLQCSLAFLAALAAFVLLLLLCES